MRALSRSLPPARRWAPGIGVVAAAALVASAASPALAHPFHGAGGVGQGFAHTLTGPDHVLALVAIGMSASLPGARARLVLLGLPILLALGASLPALGLPVPAIGGAAALLATMLVALLAIRPGGAFAATLAGGFALLSGAAHGPALVASVDPAASAAGFLVGSMVLLGLGLGVGASLRHRASERTARLARMSAAALCLVLLAAG